jgi:menaquinone-dependent protoporphyrinogen oxidase
MPILVAYASKHGATAQIAERIAEVLRGHSDVVDVGPVESVDIASGYDGYVIGGSVYMGRWHRDATTFVQRHRDQLAAAPVWLFSSGPSARRPPMRKAWMSARRPCRRSCPT